MKSKMKSGLLAVGLLLGGFAVAFAAGLYTNGLPLVGANFFPAGTPAVAPNGIYTDVLANSLLGVDTQLAGGQAPQTVAATAFQVATAAIFVAGNSATSTVHAATLNTDSGLITTESLSTAAGSTYTFTLTNSLITATSPQPMVSIHNGTNTGGFMTLTSVTNAAGSTTFVWTNTGTTALNGTVVIAFHI